MLRPCHLPCSLGARSSLDQQSVAAFPSSSEGIWDRGLCCWREPATVHYCLIIAKCSLLYKWTECWRNLLLIQCVFCLAHSDLRQELAVRERQQEVTRKSAPSSPTLDCEKMDSAVQASLSLPATPVGKGSENSFPSPKGIIPGNYAWLVGSTFCLSKNNFRQSPL